MGKIKVCYIHPKLRRNDINSLVNMLGIQGLPFTEDFVYDEEAPDYLVVSPFIYRDIRQFMRFRKFSARDDMIRIFWASECISPDMNIFDYAISFDRKLSDMDRIASRPYGVSLPLNDLTEADALNLIRSKKRFCNFIYSNAQAHSNRDKLFRSLSKYKRVDSLGPHLNNVNTLISVGGGGAKEDMRVTGTARA